MEKILDIKIPRPTKKTRKGEKEMIEVEDMADSVAVAFYCYKMSIQK